MIEARDICTTLGDKQILNGVSFEVAEGETAVLLGRSGSGKTTLLRAVNMLTPPNSGEIRVCGEVINYAAPEESQLRRLRRRVAMVFQHFNLWQHLTVLQNAMEAPIHSLGIDKTEAKQRAQQALAQVGLAAHSGHYPAQLSGGQKQRKNNAPASPALWRCIRKLYCLTSRLRHLTRKWLAKYYRSNNAPHNRERETCRWYF